MYLFRYIIIIFFVIKQPLYADSIDKQSIILNPQDELNIIFNKILDEEQSIKIQNDITKIPVISKNISISEKNLIFPTKQKSTITTIQNIKIIKKPYKQNIKYDSPNLGSLINSLEEVNTNKIPVIVIDAGHGGKDPGTIGYKKTKEKNIVLLYAKDLAKKLQSKKKYKVYLTRKKDKFLPLRSRNQIARKYNADLFISLHADAARNKKARGLSIYRLSKKSSDKEAALLARKENRADIIAGVDLSEIEKDVSNTLIDLSMRDAKNKSIIFAKLLHKNLKNKVRVRKRALHYAGFVVLKNSNMASILLEIGYLSNKDDTKNLRKKSYRNKLTDGIVIAIDEYFK